MSNTKIIQSLLNKVISEELKEYDSMQSTSTGNKRGETVFTTPDGTEKTASPEQRDRMKKMPPGTSFRTKRQGQAEASEEKEEGKAMPSATEIAGKIAEMMDSLKAISEGSEDPKMQKIADKAASQLEAAKATLEALTAHEVMLQEKQHEMFVKQAGKKRKGIERHLKKKVKMPEVVEKLMKKLPDTKIAEMLKKSQGDLDEERVAGAMMRVALKEAYISI